MTLIQIVTRDMFYDAFRDAGREKQFSYEALDALFDYYEEDAEYVNTELDVIAICCEWSEYTLDEAIESFGIELDIEDPTIDDLLDALKDEAGMVIELPSGNVLVSE